MMDKPVLEDQQPDVALPPQHPSLRIYATICVVATLFVIAAFTIKGEADWPGLFLNVSAGLISALVVLIVVERRLRQSDLLALQQVPIKAQMSLITIFSRPARAARKYAVAHLEALESLLSSYLEISQFKALEPALLSGCNLLAGPGMGKTAWMQSVVAKYARNFLNSNGKEKVVVLFPLRQWREDKSLEEAVLEHTMTFASCSRRTAQKMFKNRVSTLLLDGYDEIFMGDHFFKSGINTLRVNYPTVSISVSSRPNYPNPIPDAPVVKLPQLSDNEIEKIQHMRLKRNR